MTQDKKQFDDGGKVFPDGYDNDSSFTLWDYYAAHALSVMHGMEALDNLGATKHVAEIAAFIADDMIALKRKRERGE